MAKKRLFISYDYDHDSFLKEALVGQSRLADSPFDLADWSIKEAIVGDWQTKALSRIKCVDTVAVICGRNTTTAAGVTAELRLAQQEGKPYFFLKGYKDFNCYFPAGAKSTDKMYDWTWPNLKSLVMGGR